jgi:hypothetical protein
MYYKDNLKIVPYNIGNLLIPVSFSFWKKDDGGLGSNNELNLHTHSYKLKEVERLIKEKSLLITLISIVEKP